jgi:hypothetical protein
VNPVKKTAKDRREAQLDAASRPLRDAVNAWARSRDCGSIGGWQQGSSLWRYHIHGGARSIDVYVAVLEDGSAAEVYSADRRLRAHAATPRGLERVLTKVTATNDKGGSR